MGNMAKETLPTGSKGSETITKGGKKLDEAHQGQDASLQKGIFALAKPSVERLMDGGAVFKSMKYASLF